MMSEMMSLNAYQQQEWRKGPWTTEEDKLLSEYINLHGEGRWSSVAKSSGLNRNAKSCRLRWVNYLRPGLKRGDLTPQEEGIMIELHALWGNKWSTIARYLPGRTDNDIKNYWRTHFKKRGKPFKNQDKSKILPQKKLKQQQEADDYGAAKLSPQSEVIDEPIILSEPQGNPKESLFRYPSIDYQYIHAAMYDQQDVEPWSDTIADDYGLWDGLWNLVDQQPCMEQVQTIQNQSNFYSCGGDRNYMNDGGFVS